MISNKNILNLGTAKEGSIVNDSFVITNDSNTDIDIIGANASCGCTAPTLEKGILKVGQTRIVNVSFNTTGKKGNNNKSISIHYSELGQTKTFGLSLNCFVQ